MTDDFSSSIAAAYVAGLMMMFVFIVIYYVVLAFLLMKLFDKAGVQGKWRAWVPIYNFMVFSKLGDLSPWPILIAMAISFIPFVNYLSGLAVAVLMAMAAWRIGQKLQKEAPWVILWVLVSVVWVGILGLDKSRWNLSIPPAPWASTGFFADTTQWSGVPSQVPAGGYPQSPVAQPGTGYAAPGQQPPAAPPQPPAAPPQAQQPPAPPAPPTGEQPPQPPAPPQQ